MSDAPSLNGWNPQFPDDWARALGLVSVPMFSPKRLQRHAGTNAVLLDGNTGSFSFSSGDAREILRDQAPLSWAWSSNLRHAAVVDNNREEILLGRWDEADDWRRFRLPTTPGKAGALLDRIDESRYPQFPGVVERTLDLFRSLRAVVDAHNGSSVDTIHAFNILLAGAAAVINGNVMAEAEWKRLTTLKEVAAVLEKQDGANPDCPLPLSVADFSIKPLIQWMVERDPSTGCKFDPDLLIRHAASDLYQEAHLELERKPMRSLFLGHPGEAAAPGRPRREARWTPPALARSLVEQAFRVLRLQGIEGPELCILDPACGSGTFLSESLREFAANRPPNCARIRLAGFDTSVEACAIAAFYMRYVAADLGSDVAELDIRRDNALRVDWPKADIIVMNPPFAAWNDMGDDDRQAVKEILRDLHVDHADKAMAFVLRAAASMKPGAVLACVLPSPLLENKGGVQWREDLLGSQGLTLHMVGRFRGFSYFRGATVEPAFVVLSKPKGQLRPESVQIVLANSGSEEKALRALRKDPQGTLTGRTADWEVFRMPDWRPDASSWLPRSRTALLLLSKLKGSQLPTVGQLFNVLQGIRHGYKPAFLLPAKVVATFPADVREYFRLAVVTSSIRDGRLHPSHYIFFPYRSGEKAFTTDQELEAALGVYYTRYLAPMRKALEERASLRDREWWELSEPRLKWQAVTRPKIVTAYFGCRGKFAYDAEGDYAVVQGFAWFWAAGGPFDSTPLPMAYLALLNTPLFERMLALYCPTVRGGQYDLSPRFVKHVYLPDLSNGAKVSADAVADLADMGREIISGQSPDPRRLLQAAERVFGITLAETGAGITRY